MHHIDPRPEFSLVISTLGAAEGLRQALESILSQSYSSVEVIVVDQNHGEHVRRITDLFHDTKKVRHIRSEIGLSKGRNAGLLVAQGRIVGFPDDDCQYPPTLLAEVKAQFSKYPDASGVCVRCCDQEGRDGAGRSDRTSGLITKSNVWKRAVSIGTFLKFDAVKQVGQFDEYIGLGSSTPYQSGEETDLVLKIITAGGNIYYDPSINVIHHRYVSNISKHTIERAYAYGLGKGLLLRRYNYPTHEVALHFARPVVGASLALISGNLSLARLRYARARGRLNGWKSRLPLVTD